MVLTKRSSGTAPANEDFMGISGHIADVDLGSGDAVYLKNTAGVLTVALASAAAAGALTVVLGLVAKAAKAGRPVTIVRNGHVAGFTNLTAGAKVFLSDTPGALSHTAGTVSVPVGYAIDAETVCVSI